MSLMKCYYRDIKDLEQKLTFRAIEPIIAQLRSKIYNSMFNAEKTLKFKELIEPLNKIKTILNENYDNLYLSELNKFIDKVKIFRTHFASIDIRQHHSIHQKTVEAILKNENVISENINELPKEELISILLKKEINVNPDNFELGIIKDTIDTAIQQRKIQKKNGELASNRYIISNSEDIYSILYVYALLRWSAWGGEPMSVDIIPLFESMEGMENSKAIMTELFELKEYREHVSQRKNKQTVMLGFSDGTKDGGYLQANWSIFKTKENLSAVCKDYGIDAIFFDGRGGPPARGGGKTNQFYASQSQKIANNAIQLTIQGQTISSKYGTQEQFIHNCEQLTTAGLAHEIFAKENDISENSREIIETLAKISFEKYTDLKNHDKFIPYLEKKSTLKYYGGANIGSRPDKRGNSKKLELRDLRAIPFVGSWSQLKQNVPGYFGIGTAIKSIINEGKLDELKQLFKDSPFFRTLILNSMMALSKCNFNLTSYSAKDKEFKDFWHILLDEFNLSKEMILLISDYEILMEEEPISRSSIEIREKIVLPLLLIQQYALQKIELSTDFKSSYEKIIKRSLYGNINASRNSA